MRGRDWFRGVWLVFFAAGCGNASQSAAGSAAGASGNAGSALTPGGGAGASAGAEAGTSAGAGPSGQGGQPNPSGAGQGGAGGINDDPNAPIFWDGRCQPKGPLLADIPGVKVISAPIDFGEVRSLEMHEGTLYWEADGDQNQIWRLAAGATEPELVANGVSAFTILVRGQYLYYVSGNERSLERVSLASLPGTPELIREGIGDSSMGLYATDTDLYFRPYPAYGIQTLALNTLLPGSTATATTLTTDGQPLAMTLLGSNLYYSDFNAGFKQVSLSGGAAQIFVGLGAPGDLTATSDTLYLISGDMLIKQPVAGGSAAATSLAVGNRRFASEETGVDLAKPAVVGDRVIYREVTGALAWVKTDGSDCRIIAQVPSFSDLENHSWGMDDHYIYVIEEDKKLDAIPYP